MVCAGDKTKLLIVGTSKARKQKLKNKRITVTVCGNVIGESHSEKLLGLIVNNNLTWKEHLYLLFNFKFQNNYAFFAL